MKIVSFKGLQGLVAVFVIFWWGSIVKGERLATLKCKEYQNVVINRAGVIHLTLDPVPIYFEVFNCTNVAQLIVGGEQARYGEFPHQALLGYQKKGGEKWDYDFLCGGTLISEQHVLTAAHCVLIENLKIVRLGEYNTESNNDEAFDSDIDYYRKHPNYSNSHTYHDIALVKLKHPITFSKHVRPACLWEPEERITTPYIATGFGLREDLGKLSTVLMKVQLTDVPQAECERKLSFRKFEHGMNDGQICAGSMKEGDTCSGDSGGPLQVLVNSKSCTYAVVGITGIGGFCDDENSAALYTKVSHYIDWIEDNVWGADAM